MRNLVKNILKYYEKEHYLRPYSERKNFNIETYDLPNNITFEMMIFFRAFYNPDIDELAPFTED